MKRLLKLIIHESIHKNDKQKVTKFVIYKNFYIICMTIVFTYTATVGTNTIQSSVNKEEGLGLISTAVYYASSTLSVLFIPQFLNYLITFKWTYVLGLFLQVPFVALKAYPSWPSYIIASIIGGLGSALILYSSAYGISNLARMYDNFIATSNTCNIKSSQAYFFGIFGAFIQIGDFLGNLMNALILKHQNYNDKKDRFDYSMCGKNFCPHYELPTEAVAEPTSVYILIGVFCGFALLATLLGLFLTNINFMNELQNDLSLKLKMKNQLNEYKRQFFTFEQWLVIPINLLSGFFLTLAWAEFTLSYAACSAGIKYIGYSQMVMFATSAILSPIMGKLASKLSLQPILYLLYILMILISIYLLLWQSSPSTLYNLFILAICFGIVDSINTPQPRALYGLLFHTEVVFSAYSFFQGIGYLSGFIISTLTCTNIKIYIQIGLACLCILCDTIRIINVRRKTKRNLASIADDEFIMRTNL